MKTTSNKTKAKLGETKPGSLKPVLSKHVITWQQPKKRSVQPLHRLGRHRKGVSLAEAMKRAKLRQTNEINQMICGSIA